MSRFYSDQCIGVIQYNNIQLGQYIHTPESDEQVISKVEKVTSFGAADFIAHVQRNHVIILTEETQII